MITHSPAPWGPPTHTGMGRFEISTDRRIAVVDRYDDALLIQRAPEMLKALSLCLDWWRSEGMKHEVFWGCPSCFFEVDRVLGLIAPQAKAANE